MNVYISQGNETKVVVKADENLLDVIRTEVDKNTLKITTTENIRRAASKKVYVTVPENLEAHASSGGNIIYYGQPKSTNTESSSGGNIVKK